MNTPGTLERNWQWRLPTVKLGKQAQVLRSLAEAFGRAAPAAHKDGSTIRKQVPQ
jgi:4-alpha-glucanotransferase